MSNHPASLRPSIDRVRVRDRDRVRVGIVGCGAIAQIQYLPLLARLADRFEIGGLCDLSEHVLDTLGDRYGVPRHRRHRSFADLVAGDVDAVVVCSSGSHAPPAIAAARAGKHVLVEKPMGTTPEEAAAMVAAADEAGVALSVGYMKRHDPAYRYAAERVQATADVRFVEVRHLHPDNAVHLAKFDLVRGADLAFSARAEVEADYGAAIAGLLGYASAADVPPAIAKAFFWVHNSMIHDIGNLSGLFGPPTRVVATEIWTDGNALTTTLEYEAGFRAVCSWVDLPELPEFEETVAVYGSRERVAVSFPTGFSLGQPSVVTTQGMDETGHPRRTERRWHANPFELELLDLERCVRDGAAPLTPGRDAVADIALVRDIVRAAVSA